MVYNGFNLLSNKQLHLWLDHQKLRKQDIGDVETDVPLSKENLLFLNKDHKFTKSMFPDVFKRSVPQESQENGIAIYHSPKIEWTRIWLQQRQDRDDLPSRQTPSTFPFIVLSTNFQIGNYSYGLTVA